MRTLLILLLLLPFGTHAEERTYIDQSHDFSIKYPSNWTAMSPSSRHGAWMAQAPDGLADCGVSVYAGPPRTADREGSDSGYQALVDHSIRGGAAQFQNFSVVRQKIPIFINSRRAAMIESQFDSRMIDRTIPLHAWTFFIVANANLYSLTCRAPSLRTEEARPVVTAIANSLFIEYESS